MKLDFRNLVSLKALIEIDGLGPSKILNLVSKFGSPAEVFSADKKSLLQVELINNVLSQRILKSKSSLNETERRFSEELTEVEKNKFKLITYYDDEYPELLRNIFSPPIFLYTSGDIQFNNITSIAIVGTRRPTIYGKRQTERFAGELAEQGIVITSGLARGIDSIAHKSTLKKGGSTIAIIGSGLDNIYPPENKNLAEQISEKGAVLSEFPLGTKPDASNFPRRNRIISGLSLGTIVIESDVNGGAMQTAAFALDQNREVFAVPGNLDIPQSNGTNLLIQKGEAKLIKNAEDILVELKLKLKPEVGKNIPKPDIDLNMFEEKILEHLSVEIKHIDTIAAETSLSSSDCLVNLLSLEFKGLVKQLPGKQFLKI